MTVHPQDLAAGGDAPNKARILRAAEQLFAERGIEAVSLRAVMAAAGTNVAAVHYHFGSKAALVEALITGRSAEISARRAVLLDELESADTFTPRQLADAFVAPVVETVESGGESWVRFISTLINGTDPAMEVVSKGFFEQAIRFIALTERLHPDWTAAKVRFRLARAMTVTFQVLGDVPGVQRTVALAGTELSRGDVIAELTDLVTSVLTA